MNNLRLLLIVPLMFMGLALSPLGLVGCAAFQSASAAEQTAAHVYDAAVLGLVLLDGVEAQYLRSLKVPTDEQLSKARKRVAHLREIRDSLALIKSEFDRADVSRRLAEALGALRQVAEALKAVGAPVPPDALEALTRAEKWAGLAA